MNSSRRILLIVVGLLVVATGVGLVVTSDWGSRTVSLGTRQPGVPQSPVDMHQMQTGMELAPLAASPEEQDSARDALRAADHEVDFEFAAALYEATSQPVPSTPEIQAIQERISKSKASVAEIKSDIARINKLLASANENQKPAIEQQLDLANVRLELNEDELADATTDLGRAGGDPKSGIQRMVDEHYSAPQDKNGELDLGEVGKQAGATQPVSNSFLGRARAWYELHSISARLTQAEQEAKAKAAKFSANHDELDRELQQSQSQQSKKLADSPSVSSSAGATAAARASKSDRTDAAISAYRSLTALQKRMSSLDGRIR